MKKTIPLFLSLTLLISCVKAPFPQFFQNAGVITGLDFSELPCIAACPCSSDGGIYFHFTDTSYTANIVVDNSQIFNLPAGTQFPVHVMVDWQNTTRCGIPAIKVTRFMVVPH
ncbi:MAG TPA: hypothetical protein VMV20_03905 [Chitinophagaceae bacterium]|nr:hypothetical protein [Chitinophagaceae bacterium]